MKLLSKIELDKTQLSQICDFCLGLTPYDKYKGHSQTQIKNKVFHSSFKKNASFKPLLTGGSINRFSVIWDEKHFISYGDWLGAPREQRFFTKPRILIRQIISGKPPKIYCAFTDKEYYNTQTIFNLLISNGLNISLKYLLAILNSKLITYYHRNKFLDQSKSTFQKILIQDAKQFPIFLPNDNKTGSVNFYNKLINLSDFIILLNDKLNKVKTPTEITALQRQIDATDKQIDKLVYQLYGLTEKEIKIVEQEN